MAMVLVTHDLGVVAGRTDEIDRDVRGAGRREGADRDAVRGHEMPYTEALLHSIPKLAEPSHTRLAAIPGRPPDLVNPPDGLPVRRPLRVRAGPVPRGAAAAASTAPTPGHEYRCWFPVGTPEGRAALERNRAAAAEATPAGSAA